MIKQDDLNQQLKALNYHSGLWGRSEIQELATVLTQNEQISQIVNGYYENGFALLVSTDQRVLLIDKKPFSFLNVEDFRFDMINQLDYNHRLFNSSINISAGPKNLKFISYNQSGLRNLLDRVQCRMIEIKQEKKRAQEVQQDKLDRLDRTLRAYIMQSMQLREKPKEDENVGAGAPGAPERADFATEVDEQLATRAESEFDKYLNQVGQVKDTTGSFIRTGSLLPRSSRRDLVAAKIAFAKLPFAISRLKH